TQASGSTGAGQGDADYQAGTGDGGSGGTQGGNNGTVGEPGAVVIIYTAGTITSPTIDFDSFVDVDDWNELLFTDVETNGTVSYDVEYWDGDSWEDTSITGQGSSPVDISGLDPVTHNQIRIEATLVEGTGTPYLQDWTVTASDLPGAPTLYSTGGSEQLSFNNVKQNTTTPRFRAAANCPTDMDRFYIELNTQADFGGTAYTQTFSGTYTSGTQYNLLCNSLSPSLPTTDGVTYYVRAKASADAGVSWGAWSSGTWSFTYSSSAGYLAWHQTTDEQFDTGTLNGTQTDAPNDRVKLSTAWLSGWDKRIKLTVDSAGSKVDSDLSDFPILVYLSTSSGITNADVSAVFDELTADANRKKIAVTKSDGTTECYVEIEDWDDASEEAWLWTKVSGTNSVSSSSDTELYLYYDVDHADNTTYVGDPNSAASENVWDANFVGVWHLDETSGTTIYDSTSNDLTGTANAQITLDQDGKIGRSADVDPSTGSIDSSVSLPATYSTWTVEGWLQLDSTPGWGNMWADSAGSEQYPATIWGGGTFGAYDSSQLQTTSTFTEDGTTWTYVTSKCDGTDTFVYWNGSQENTNTDDLTISGSWSIGDRTASGEEMDGRVDEIRVSNISRSAAWIEASFHSGNDSLITFGSEETTSFTIISPSIDHDSFEGAEDWNQLLFTDIETNGTVSYDVEYWDGDSWEDTSITGQGSSPVDISSLDPATHDQIRIEATLTETTDTPYLQDWTVTILDVDNDGDLTSAAGVVEPVAISSIADTVGERVAVFDFTISDGGTSDALALGVSQIELNTSGTGTFTDLTWQLNGPDASYVTGT
ncbi:MAG: LamG-like jellyroll fold domain-containing protein, partial [Planctomycetota bacterium]